MSYILFRKEYGLPLSPIIVGIEPHPFILSFLPSLLRGNDINIVLTNNLPTNYNLNKALQMNGIDFSRVIQLTPDVTLAEIYTTLDFVFSYSFSFYPLWNGIPILTLSELPYSPIPGVINCVSVKECQKIFRRIIHYKDQIIKVWKYKLNCDILEINEINPRRVIAIKYIAKSIENEILVLIDNNITSLFNKKFEEYIIDINSSSHFIKQQSILYSNETLEKIEKEYIPNGQYRIAQNILIRLLHFNRLCKSCLIEYNHLLKVNELYISQLYVLLYDYSICEDLSKYYQIEIINILEKLISEPNFKEYIIAAVYKYIDIIVIILFLSLFLLLYLCHLFSFFLSYYIYLFILILSFSFLIYYYYYYIR